MTTPLQDLRKSYELGELLESQVAATPMAQFQTWFDHALASSVPEPNAMTLSTVGVDAQGMHRPTSRIVLIKSFDAQGICWFTNYQSRKGQELAANTLACLQFFWVELERQVRFEGRVEKLSPQDNDTYYNSRPLGSRIGAWASPQSQVIASREDLLTREAAAAQAYGDAPPRPPHWGGYRLVPDYAEFWQGRPNRLHDRMCYRLDGTHWTKQRLAP